MADTNADRRPSIGALIRAGAPSVSPHGQRAGWVRLKGALDRRQAGARRRPVLMTLAACGTGAIVVVALAATHFARRPVGDAVMTSPLTYAVDRGELQSDGSIRNTDPLGARLRFSDGSNVSLEPATRAEVVSVESRGARIAVGDGELVVDVVHRPSTRWRFDAGPFTVLVEGTSFSLGWSAADERLDLQMRSGIVTVKGPLGSDPIRVRAGERLTVRVPEQQIQLEGSGQPHAGPSTPMPGSASTGVSGRIAGDVPAVEPGLAPPAAVVQEHGNVSRAASAAHAGGGERSSWRDLVAAGRSSDVVLDAENRGLGATLAHGGRDDLAALADAARYSRRNDVAARALDALRDRFPTSDAARDAAFFLGRMEEEDNPRSPRCLEWYRRYRAEAPHGLYVSDSLGREMLTMQRLYGDDGARAIAREYLARFPGGHLAARAAQIANR
jgi:TolA-binding protein